MGMVVKSFQNDAWSTSLGINRGNPTPPSINLTIATPAMMATNTTAKPTDNADVYLNESSIIKMTSLPAIMELLLLNVKQSKKQSG